MAGQAPPQGPIPDLRSMEELLQAPTDGVGDAIVLEVQNSRNKPQVASASGSSVQDAHISSLTKQVEALLALHRPVDSVQNGVNSVQNGCKTCGGPHPYFECQATGGYTQDVYATSGTYNQGGSIMHALADLGASINLMPLSVWKTLSLPDLSTTYSNDPALVATQDYLLIQPVKPMDVFVLSGKITFPADLFKEGKKQLLKVLKSHKRAISWKISDIRGIDPNFCTHKILMEDDFKLVVQHQRRVNPKIHEVIKAEVIKLLDAGLICPISDSPWEPDSCCTQKRGMRWFLDK
ncbi:hypothetical protein Tco_1400337 [Tanacetum coccineum]